MADPVAITCIACGKRAMRQPQAHSGMCLPCAGTHLTEAQRAASKVGAQIARGAILPAKAFACTDCGKPATEYDHRDYLAPLVIVPVCRSCNHKRGPAFNSVYRPAGEAAPPVFPRTDTHRLQRRRIAARLDVRCGEPIAPVRLVHGLHPRTRAPGPS